MSKINVFILTFAIHALVAANLVLDFGSGTQRVFDVAPVVGKKQNLFGTEHAESPVGFSMARWDTQATRLGQLMAVSLADEFVDLGLARQQKIASGKPVEEDFDSALSQTLTDRMDHFVAKGVESYKKWLADHPQLDASVLKPLPVSAEFVGGALTKKNEKSVLEVISSGTSRVAVFRVSRSLSSEKEVYYYRPHFLSANLGLAGVQEQTTKATLAETGSDQCPADFTRAMLQWQEVEVQNADLVLIASNEFFELVPLSFITFAVNFLALFRDMPTHNAVELFDYFVDRLSKKAAAKLGTGSERRLSQDILPDTRSVSVSRQSSFDSTTTANQKSKNAKLPQATKAPAKRSALGSFFHSYFTMFCGCGAPQDEFGEDYIPKTKLNRDSFIGASIQDQIRSMEVEIGAKSQTHPSLKSEDNEMEVTKVGKRRLMLKEDQEFSMLQDTSLSKPKDLSASRLDQSYASSNMPKPKIVEPEKPWHDYINIFKMLGCMGARDKGPDYKPKHNLRPKLIQESDQSELQATNRRSQIEIEKTNKPEVDEWLEEFRKRSPQPNGPLADGSLLDPGPKKRALSQTQPTESQESDDKFKQQALYFDSLFECSIDEIVHVSNSRASSGKYLSECMERSLAWRINFEWSSAESFLDAPSIERFSEVMSRIALKFAQANPAVLPLTHLDQLSNSQTKSEVHPADVFVAAALVSNKVTIIPEAVAEARGMLAHNRRQVESIFDQAMAEEWNHVAKLALEAQERNKVKI